MSSSATSGRVRRAAAEHLVAALDLGHDLDVALQGEQARERSAHHGLVLGDQDADHGVASGTLSRRRKPPSGRGAGLERAVHALGALGEPGQAAAGAARP